MATAVINGALPATGSVAIYSVLQMLVAIGATKTRDSDGTTYSASGTQVTSGGSNTNGLANTSAWFVMRLPSGREYCFQRGSNNTLWRIMYSAQAGFTGGSPGATRVPTATDQATIFGGGTDASPTYNQFFSTDASYRLYGLADTVYGFWFGSVLTASSAASAGMWHDLITPASSVDDDPCVTHLSVSGVAFTQSAVATVTAATTGTRTAGWLRYGEASESGHVALSGMPLRDGTGNVVFPDGAGVNPHDNKDQLRLIPYARGSTQTVPYGDKGLSKIAAWCGTPRSTLETYSVSSTRDWLRMGSVALRWNGDVVVPV